VLVFGGSGLTGNRIRHSPRFFHPLGCVQDFHSHDISDLVEIENDLRPFLIAFLIC